MQFILYYFLSPRIRYSYSPQNETIWWKRNLYLAGYTLSAILLTNYTFVGCISPAMLCPGLVALYYGCVVKKEFHYDSNWSHGLINTNTTMAIAYSHFHKYLDIILCMITALLPLLRCQSPAADSELRSKKVRVET
jgi:hypothetical protein